MNSIKDDTVAINLTIDELAATINLLEFTIGAFSIMSDTANNHNDAQSVENLQLRIEFAKLLSAKLLDSLETTDGNNRTYH